MKLLDEDGGDDVDDDTGDDETACSCCCDWKLLLLRYNTRSRRISLMYVKLTQGICDVMDGRSNEFNNSADIDVFEDDGEEDNELGGSIDVGNVDVSTDGCICCANGVLDETTRWGRS